MYEAVVDFVDSGLKELKVSIGLIDGHLPIELKDVDGVSLVEDGLKTTDVMTLDPNARMGLKVMFSQSVSLPLGQTVKSLKVDTWH